MMRRSLISMLCGALGAIALTVPAVSADNSFPDKPITIIVPYPPGGSADLIGRLLAAQLGSSIGQTVIVENKGGASGAIGSGLVARAKPDGYTVLVGISDTHAINPAVKKHIDYDPLKDFEAISLLAVQPLTFSVGSKSKATTLAEFIDEAKKAPGKISYASNGVGGMQHLATNLLSSMTGMELLHVPYKGSGPALADVIGGHVNGIFISVQGSGGNFASGNLRPLAITAANRLDVAPDIPTFAELGFKTFQVQQWYGLFAPSGTPADIVAKLNKHVAKSMKSKEIAGVIGAKGTQAIGSSSEEFLTFLKKEITQWATVAKKNNISVN